MKAAAVVLAAGAGERLGSETPKAFVDLEGRPLLAYALELVTAHPRVLHVVVAAPPGWEAEASSVAGDGVAVMTGGSSRQRSVALAVRALADRREAFDAVLCHDAARPRAGSVLVDRVLDALARADGAVPAVPVPDTVKRVAGGRVVETLPREEIVRAQTPQAFRWEALRDAHARAEQDGFEGTDDAALLERIGLTVAVVEGDPGNIKVTSPDDLRLAALLGRADA